MPSTASRPERIAAIQAFSRQYLQYEPRALDSNVETFLGAHDPLLFCYAVNRPEFHLDVLLEGLGLLRESHPRLGLLLAGCYEANDRLDRQITAAGLGSAVLQLGNLDHDTFLTLMSRADLCVRTPSRDGIASSVLESLALGIPVVAAENPMRPPQVVTYKTTDAADLARAVEGVLALPKQERRPRAPRGSRYDSG